MSLQSKQGFYLFLSTKSSFGVIVALLLLGVINGVKANSLPDKQKEEAKEQLKITNKPAVTTITSEDGDVVDCIDIYEQPAFDHPLLRNQKVEMRPSFIPKIVDDNNSTRSQAQRIWQKIQSCPEGTIPIQQIRGTSLNNIYNSSNTVSLAGELINCTPEVAQLELNEGGPYIGATALMNVWNPHVEAGEWSLNSIAVIDPRNSTFEAGWMVSPTLFKDGKPRLFVSWMEPSKAKGCLNLRCPGFVQVSNKIILGSPLPNISRYEGEQFAYTFIIYGDAVQGTWWLVFEDEPVGYWPSFLTEGFGSAERVNWGGRVCDSERQGFHTLTQMGSGHFPIEGFKRASYMRNVMAMDSNKNFVAPKNPHYSASYAGCYKVDSECSFPGDKGPCIYYGGPGGKCCDARCRKRI